MAYWFDRGCDGFRVDMAGSLIKVEGQPRAQAETQRLWQEIRRWIDETYPGKALLAEWSSPIASIEAGFHLDFLMHFNAPGYPSLFFNGVGSLPAKEGPCYFHRDGEGQLKIFREEYQRQLQGVRGKGFISLPLRITIFKDCTVGLARRKSCDVHGCFSSLKQGLRPSITVRKSACGISWRLHRRKAPLWRYHRCERRCSKWRARGLPYAHAVG